MIDTSFSECSFYVPYCSPQEGFSVDGSKSNYAKDKMLKLLRQKKSNSAHQSSLERFHEQLNLSIH